MKWNSDKWLIIPCVLLLITFIYRLIDQAKMLNFFPLDYVNDWSSYIAQLHFLKECGFHQYCQYWYNGFTAFLITPPGWYFFAYPLLLLSNDVLYATYFSMILIYLIGFIFIYYFGKLNNFSLIKIIAFFSFFFANPISIGNHIKQGRIVELFSFMLLIPIALILFNYKDRRIDRFFYFLIPIYSLLIISHFQEAFLFSFFIFGFFLYKKGLEKIYIIISIILSLIISSFWLIPFLLNVKNSILLSPELSSSLLSFREEFLFNQIIYFLIPMGFLILFFFHYRNSRKREFLFYLPVLIISFLYLTRLVVFIPIFKNISPDIYNLFFSFFLIYFFLKLNIKKFNKYFIYLIKFGIIILSLFSFYITIARIPYFSEYTELEYEILDTLRGVKGSFIIADVPDGVTSYPKAYYSYAPIFLNLTTPSGFYQHLMSEDYYNLLKEFQPSYYSEDCDKFLNIFKELKINYIVSSLNKCGFFEKCSLRRVREEKYVCLIEG